MKQPYRPLTGVFLRRLSTSVCIPYGFGDKESLVRPQTGPFRPRTYATQQSNDGTQKSAESSVSEDVIHRLISHPALYDPIRTPRYPIVLCHGLYGFDSRELSLIPAIKMEYWSNVLHILRKVVGAQVIVTSVPPTGSITERSKRMDSVLRIKANGQGVNFLGHSMGGLDCRHLISQLKPQDYVPLSLMTVSTPHRGSPFMDWCAENIGLGRLRKDDVPAESIPSASEVVASAAKQSIDNDKKSPPSASGLPLSLSSLPSSLTTLISSVLDSPAYANLTSTYLTQSFNPATPDSPSVKYFSVAARCGSMFVWHPLWLPKLVLDGYEDKLRAKLRADGDPRGSDDSLWGNDGIVTVESSKWGEFLGVLNGCDHWEIRGARGLELPDFQNLENMVSVSDALDWRKLIGRKKEKESVSEKKIEGVSDVQPLNTTKAADDQKEKDKLGRVVDWLTDKVPSPPQILQSEKVVVAGKSAPKEKEKSSGKMVNELETKEDLERFYVALAKKLYDEGL